MANDPIDLAWAAGFIDGEGCIGVYGRTDNRGSYALRLSVAQVDPRPLLVLQSMFGGRIRQTKPRGSKSRPASVWELHNWEARDAITAILPYLRGKQEQAELALKFQERIHHGLTGRPYRLTDEEREVREDMARQLKEMKRVVR